MQIVTERKSYQKPVLKKSFVLLQAVTAVFNSQAED